MLYTISLHITASAGASPRREIFQVILHTRHLTIRTAGCSSGRLFFTRHSGSWNFALEVVTSVALVIAVKSPKVAISIIVFCFLLTMVDFSVPGSVCGA
jgi:hypothetical protein